MRISIVVIHVGRRLGSLVQLPTVQNVCGSEQEQKNNDETSTEMRACPFSGLPGGYLEALCAGARLKSAHSLQRSEPCETTSCMPVTGIFQEIPDYKVNSRTSERSRRPT